MNGPEDEISKRRKKLAAAEPTDPVMAMVKDAFAKAMKAHADQQAEEKALRKEVGRIADALTKIAHAVRRDSRFFRA